MYSPASVMSVIDLRQLLNASRQTLLDAVRDLTEEEFLSALDTFSLDRTGDSTEITVVAYLSTLAPDEREAVRLARGLVGAKPRALPTNTTREQVLPPQLIHDLAGARYETLLFLEDLDDSQLNVGSDQTVLDLFDAVARRETEAAQRLSEHFSKD